MKTTLALTLCLSLLLPAAAQARERPSRGGCYVVVEVLAAPFVWVGGLFRPAPAVYAPSYRPVYAPGCEPVRRGCVSDTDYMLYGSGRRYPEYR